MKNSVFNNLVVGGLTFFLKLTNSILLVPLFLSLWGKENYGIWLLIFASFAIFQVLDAGYRSYISNEINIVFKIDKEKSRLILGSSLLISVLISFIPILLLILLFQCNYIDDFFGINKSVLSPLNFVLCIIFLQFPHIFFGNTTAILTATFYPLDKLVLAQLLTLFNEFVRVVMLLIIIFLNYSILKSCFLYGLFSCFLGGLNILIIKNNANYFYPWWKYVDLKLGVSGLKKSLFITINSFVGQLSNNGLIILISQSLGQATVPLFTTTRTISNTIVQISYVTGTATVLEIVNKHINKEGDKLKDYIYYNWFVNSLLFYWGMIIILPFIEQLYNAWTRYKISFNHELFALLMISSSYVMIGHILFQYLVGLNQIFRQNIFYFSKNGLLFIMLLYFYPFSNFIEIGWSILAAEFIAYIGIAFFFTHRNLNSIGNHFLFDRPTITIISTLLIGNLYFISYIKYGFEFKFYIIFVVTITYSLWQFWQFLTPSSKISIKQMITNQNK